MNVLTKRHFRLSDTKVIHLSDSVVSHILSAVK